MMPEWHQLDSPRTLPKQQKSTKKKTLKSSSRSFWFSAGLMYYGRITPLQCSNWSSSLYLQFAIHIYTSVDWRPPTSLSIFQLNEFSFVMKLSTVMVCR